VSSAFTSASRTCNVLRHATCRQTIIMEVLKT